MIGIDWNTLPPIRDTCNRCNTKLGDIYQADAGDVRKFFYRDCPGCGTQHLVRMVQTWQ